MPVELELIVTRRVKMELAIHPTLLDLTVVMLLIAISRRKVMLKALVIFLALQPLPLLILVVLDVLIPLVSVQQVGPR